MAYGRQPDRTGDYHRQFADAVIEQIRKGTAPWQKPWRVGESYRPENFVTGKPYTGGKRIYRRVEREVPFFRTYTVFNVEQAGGLALEREGGAKTPEWQAHQAAEAVIEESQVRGLPRPGGSGLLQPQPRHGGPSEAGAIPLASHYYQSAWHYPMARVTRVHATTPRHLGCSETRPERDKTTRAASSPVEPLQRLRRCQAPEGLKR